MELRDYLRGLRRHWLAVVLMTLVGAGVAYGWYLLQSPVYQATAIGLVQTRSVGEAAVENENLVSNPALDSYARAKVPTYMDMATWKPVAERAIAQLGLSDSPEQVITRVTIENPSDTSIIRITANGSSPAEAAALAQAWLDSLTAQIDETEGNQSAGSSPITIYVTASATLPSTPVFPDLQTSLIVGTVLGLGVGIAFALMRTASDRRIRAADDVESRTGLPIVGTIPLTDAAADTRLFDSNTLSEKGSRFAVAEALRAMRTNLQFMDADNPPRTIVVTSPVPSDGKSTIACNLALTLAAGGRKVVLLDGDLRRSTVAKTMGLPGGAGLSDVLSGRAELSEVLQRTTLSENLFVLTAGSAPPNPSEVLGSERMHHLLEDLAKHAMVIIDAPPLLPVTDGAVLAHQADGALLVVSLGKTTYDLLDKAVDTLGKAGGRALGVVLNKAPLRGADASAYSYEYRREYSAGVERGAAAPAQQTADAEADLDVIFGDAPPAGARTGSGNGKPSGQRVRQN
jgi:capsular exopolysaccharide synthesis family protein